MCPAALRRDPLPENRTEVTERPGCEAVSGMNLAAGGDVESVLEQFEY